MNLVYLLSIWVESVHRHVSRLGAVVAFDRSPGDRLNDSARLLLTREGREGELIVWASGEAEFAFVSGDGSIVEEHFDCLDHEALAARLAMILEVCE